MFTKFAKNKNSSTLLVEEMAKKLEKVAYNPVEDEYLEPESASVDPAAPETRHFHLNPDEDLFGLDLDQEDMSSMHEEGLSADELKLEEAMEGLKGLSDESLDKVVALIDELNSDREALEMEEEEEILPLSTATRKVSLPSLPGEEGLSLKKLFD